MFDIEIRVKKIHYNAVLPQYAHGADQDAGMDLCAVEEYYLAPGVPTLVRTGLAVELPPGVEAQIRPRSGLALKHGLTVVNSPGTVDPSYRGEIGVILQWGGYNPNGLVPGDATRKVFHIKLGDRIAQMVVTRYIQVSVVEINELTTTTRGSGGYGSTGSSVRQ